MTLIRMSLSIYAGSGSRKHFRSRYEATIMSFGRQAKIDQQLLHHLFFDPVANVKDTSKVLNVAFDTANSLIKKFTREKILHELMGFSRNKLYNLEEYINLFKR